MVLPPLPESRAAGGDEPVQRSVLAPLPLGLRGRGGSRSLRLGPVRHDVGPDAEGDFEAPEPVEEPGPAIHRPLRVIRCAAARPACHRLPRRRLQRRRPPPPREPPPPRGALLLREEVPPPRR